MTTTSPDGGGLNDLGLTQAWLKPSAPRRLRALRAPAAPHRQQRAIRRRAAGVRSERKIASCRLNSKYVRNCVGDPQGSNRAIGYRFTGSGHFHPCAIATGCAEMPPCKLTCDGASTRQLVHCEGYKGDWRAFVRIMPSLRQAQSRSSAAKCGANEVRVPSARPPIEVNSTTPRAAFHDSARPSSYPLRVRVRRSRRCFAAPDYAAPRRIPSPMPLPRTAPSGGAFEHEQCSRFLLERRCGYRRRRARAATWLVLAYPPPATRGSASTTSTAATSRNEIDLRERRLPSVPEGLSGYSPHANAIPKGRRPVFVTARWGAASDRRSAAEPVAELPGPDGDRSWYCMRHPVRSQAAS